MITITDKSSFNKTTSYLKEIGKKNFSHILDKYGKKGVEALKKATPSNTGKTADSWEYNIVNDLTGISLVFTNTNIQNGVPIVILLQYGHGTKNGGYVKGHDFVSPAIKPLFKQIADEAWEEVKNL